MELAQAAIEIEHFLASEVFRKADMLRQVA
jgi:hypothetical protein